MSETPPRTDRLPLPRRRTIVTILLTLVVFVSGMFVGGAVTVNFLWNRLVYNLHNPENISARVANRVGQVLQLDEETRADIQDIISRHHNEIIAIRRENYPRLLAILEAIQTEVAAELPPEQAARWETMFTNVQENLFPPPGGE